MIAQLRLPPELAYRLGWTLLHSLWLGAAVALALAVVLTVLRRRSPQTRYAAASIALLAISIGIGVIFHQITPPAIPAVGVQPPAAAPIALNLSSTPVSSNVPPVEPPPSNPDVSPAATKPLHTPQPTSLVAPAWWTRSPPACVSIVWICGVLLLSLRNLGGWIAVQRLRVLGVEPVDAALAATVNRLAARLKLWPFVRVMRSRRVGWDGVLFSAYHVNSLPQSYLVDQKGQMRATGEASGFDKTISKLRSNPATRQAPEL